MSKIELTREDADFLKELQHELLTQPTATTNLNDY